ncbi:MAG: aspartate kinase [Lachnospiraceae bacterium]|nr:aspartate kinase [Lachnospiraceae bacterium]
MQKFVAKFGGSSLADAGQFKKVADIIKARPCRRYIVASAPGKRSSDDIKVTDMLYACYDKASEGEDFKPALSAIRERFNEIMSTLEIDFDLDSEIEKIAEHLSTNPDKDYMASRGEYLNSKLLAAYLGFKFIDAADCIHFDANGRLDNDATDEGIFIALKNIDYAVIPGFYGSLPDGSIHTFSRGGSDITGSLVARAVRADMYENWTDVSGMLSADPRIVENPEPIDAITYRELRELSYMGASVMHEAAVFPVRKANISMNIRNTNRPEDNGTLISAELPRIPRKRKVAGIAGKKGFSAVLVETPSMNEEIGFGAHLLNIFARHNVNFEHLPTGIDTMSVVVHNDEFSKARNDIIDDISNEIEPESLYVEDNLALIAVVGLGMAYSRGTAARVMRALADSRVNIKMIDQGSTEINIIIGVDEADYETAIRSIYKALFEND